MKTKAKGRIWNPLLPSGKCGYRWVLRTIETTPAYAISDGSQDGRASNTIAQAKSDCRKAARALGFEIVEWDGIKERKVSDES